MLHLANFVNVVYPGEIVLRCGVWVMRGVADLLGDVQGRISRLKNFFQSRLFPEFLDQLYLFQGAHFLFIIKKKFIRNLDLDSHKIKETFRICD